MNANWQRNAVLIWLVAISCFGLMTIVPEPTLTAAVMIIIVTAVFLCFYIVKVQKETKRKPIKKMLNMKERGWLTYVRNLKSKKVDEYINRLKRKYPDLADKQIRVRTNKAGNKTMSYTLNTNLRR